MESDASQAEDLLEMIEAEEAYLSQFGVLDPWTTPDALRSRWAHDDQALEESVEQLVGDGRLIWLRSFAEDGRPRLERDFATRRYRSRLAETLRLLSLVRQRFPGRRVEESPELVTGLFWHALPKKTPRREHPCREALGEAARRFSSVSGFERAAEVLREAWGDKELSAFQTRALNAVLGEIALARLGGDEDEEPGGRGLVLQAPTGAGKTWAFFLPALLEPVLRRLEPSQEERGCSVLAIYPRKALATDQLTAALPLIEALNRVLEREALEPLTVGVAWTGQLYGWPPRPGPEDSSPWVRSSAGGWTVRFLPCYRCGGPLHAPQASQAPTLSCRRCNVDYPEIKYVWDGYRATPPDLLVAVTETLHRRLSSTVDSPVFGRPGRRTPSLVLLDEVHLYSGLYGSQVSSLVRRLRRRLQEAGNRRSFVVGLSATLELAVPFFSRLTGIDPTDICELAPSQEELQRAGTEAVAFVRAGRRSPPLATAIQAAMVVGHTYLRDASDEDTADRMFVFADNLDLVNRLSHDLGDAEQNQRLFELRLTDGSDPLPAPHACEECDVGPDRDCPVFVGGECWWSARDSGARPLAVSAVSSQGGDSSTGRLVVTSPSLEVGIDDRRLASTIQYLAPPSPANFIQRRGRAGRTLGSRPLSALVLSPFRPTDMFVFRNPSALISPALPPIPLNPGNMLARRTQGFAAVLDRFAASEEGRSADLALDRQLDERSLSVFARWVARQTQIASDVAALWRESRSNPAIDRVLFHPGTGLLSTLLPHLLQTDAVGRKPLDRLEDYLPGALFSELKVPDFAVHLPAAGSHEMVRREEIDVAFAATLPGNVTYRYSRTRSEPLWVPRSPFSTDANRSIDAASVYELRDTGVQLSPSALPSRQFHRLRSTSRARPVRLLRPLGLLPRALAPITLPFGWSAVPRDAWCVWPDQPAAPWQRGSRGSIVIDSRTFAISRHWVERDSQTGPGLQLLGLDGQGLCRGLGSVSRLATGVEGYLTGESGGLATFRATLGGSTHARLRTGRQLERVTSDFGFVFGSGVSREDVALGWNGRCDGLAFRFNLARARALAREVLANAPRLRNDILWKVFRREVLRLTHKAQASVFAAERALELVAAALIVCPVVEAGPDLLPGLASVRPTDRGWLQTAVAAWQDLYATVGDRVEDDDAACQAPEAEVEAQAISDWLQQHAELWTEALERMSDHDWLQERIDEIVVHSFGRMLRVAALRTAGAADARDFVADDALEVRPLAGAPEWEIFVFETALEGAGLCQSLVTQLQERPEGWGDEAASLVQQCPTARESTFLREVALRAPQDHLVREYLQFAQQVHDATSLAVFKRKHREIFQEPLLDWNLAALRTRGQVLLATKEEVPCWWELSADLIRLDEELSGQCGFTPPVELLVWAAVRRSDGDDSLPAVRALRSWLAGRLGATTVTPTLASVLERFVLRGCTDGCPDCLAGLPDEVEAVHRFADLLLSRALTAAILERDWVNEAIALDPGGELPHLETVFARLLAECRRGPAEVSLVFDRADMGKALALVAEVTGTGLPIGLKVAPIAVRAASRLSDGRILLTLGLAD